MYLVPQSEIKIGNMRFFGGNTGINAVEIDTSVKKLVSTAKITLPANFKNSEGKKITELMHVGDKAEIRLGYNGKHLLREKSRAEVRRILDNAEQYRTLKANTDYKDVDFDWKTGGLKATHKDHNFTGDGGDYEKAVQNAGYNNGRSVILEKEIHNIYKKKNIEGEWDGKSFEISGKKTATSNNIREGLKHCAKKPNCKIAVLYFPRKNFNIEEFNDGLKKFNGLKKDPNQWCRFEKIICIQDGKIIYEKSHIG